MIKNNPFKDANMLQYQRGECAAENLYIACCLLLRSSGRTGVYNISQPNIYQIVLDLLDKNSVEQISEKSYHIIHYFNRKIFSANKYTPFDDAYWARDAVRDSVKGEKLFNMMSLCYLYSSGVRYAQIATSVKGVKEQNACIDKFINARSDVSYKLLAHSPEVYMNKDTFVEQFGKIKELFVFN